MIGRPNRPRIIAACALIAGCGIDPLGIDSRLAPAIDAASVATNSHNVLSAVVAVRVRGADSAAVRFHLADTAAAAASLTPTVPVVGDSATIPVLGLLPARRYSLRAVAHGPGGITLGAPLDLTSDTLPADLPRYTAAGVDPATGYVVFAAGRYGLAIDNTGRVVWYRRFPNGPGLTFMAQPNGRYFARLPPPQPADPTPWVELDPLGNVTRTFGCARGLAPRFHDLIAQPDGTYWLMCDETRMMELTDVGGIASAKVTGTAVQHISADGTLLFNWSPFDHFAITDGDPRDRTGASVNWTHGNALDLDDDGNLIVSFRNLREITKIDASTGTVIWRLGGRRNQFTFLGAPEAGFAAQHGARAIAPGVLLLLDNLGDASESRAERYALDEGSLTARLVRSYGSAPGVVTEIGGSVQTCLAGAHLSRSAPPDGSRSTTPRGTSCGASMGMPATSFGPSASARSMLRASAPRGEAT
jgi:arylsulfotransferase ASST